VSQAAEASSCSRVARTKRRADGTLAASAGNEHEAGLTGAP
jgi:hypothetical protein